MNILLCEDASGRAYTAGNKARTDTVRILQNMGYVHIPLYRSEAAKPLVLWQMLTACWKAVGRIEAGERLVIQYPYYPFIVNRLLVSLLRRARRKKGFQMVLLVHDVIGLRSPKTGKLWAKEVQLLETADHLICHSTAMVEALQAMSKTVDAGKYRILGPFDYLYEGSPVEVRWQQEPQVIVAGNLSREKSGYVYELSGLKNVKWNLYGVGYKGAPSENVTYYGTFPPEQLIERLQGQWGLVWDGPSCDTCGGMYGAYLQYNSPHKFSLYMAAGIPVIVWKKSALAPLVEQQGLGVAVDSLTRLEQILMQIDGGQYELLRQNVLELRGQLVQGESLHKVMASIESA